MELVTATNLNVGADVGATEGASLGAWLGTCEGALLGADVGESVGESVGEAVGAFVSSQRWPAWGELHPATHSYSGLHSHAQPLGSVSGMIHCPPSVSQPWLPSLHG